MDLQLGPGVFGLLGPNGAGKTSLLRMLATVLPPSSGEIRLLDRDPRGAAARREIRRRLGYLPQNLGYYPSFTVVEFIEYFALLKEMPSAAVPKAVAAAVERVDLGVKAKAKLRTLSGGMLRRVGIAQAIVNDPDLLLLDEPTAGLDPEQRVQFRSLMRVLGESATVIVSTHLVEDVGAACAEVALMSDGKIVFRGTPAELTARGEGHGVGDAPLERGYSAVLSAARLSAAQSGAVSGVMSVLSVPAVAAGPVPAGTVLAGAARGGPGAAARVQAERGAVGAAAARGGVLLRRAAHGRRVPARVGPAGLRHPRPHVVGVRRVRGRARRLGGVAGGPQEDPRPGRHHAARGVGAAVRRPRGNAVLGAARVPRRGRGDLRADRPAGDLGRPAAMAGLRRRGLRDRGDRARVRRRGVLPRAVHRAAGGHRRVPALPGRLPPGTWHHAVVWHVRAAFAGRRRAAGRRGHLLPRRAGRLDRAGHVHGRDRGRAVRRARPGAGAARAPAGRRPCGAARRARPR